MNIEEKSTDGCDGDGRHKGNFFVLVRTKRKRKEDSGWDVRNKIKKTERRRQWLGIREKRSRRKREEEIPVEKP